MLFNILKNAYVKHAYKKITIVESSTEEIEEIFQNTEDLLVVTGNSAWKHFQNYFQDGTNVPLKNIYKPRSVDIKDVTSFKIPTNITRIVGIGGGKVMDVTKFLIVRAKKEINKNIRGILVPSILSTTAWLNSTASLKDGKKVIHKKGYYDRVIILSKLIAQAPPEFTFGGIMDSLVGFTSLEEWNLEKDNAQNKKIIKIRQSNQSILSHISQMDCIRQEDVGQIVDYFIQSMGNCYGALSGRPLDGGEHLLYYLMEEEMGDPGIHGRIIVFNMLIMLYIMERLNIKTEISFSEFKKHVLALHIPYQKFAHKIQLKTLQKMINYMPQYVANRKAPYSLWTYIQEKNISQSDLETWVADFYSQIR